MPEPLIRESAPPRQSRTIAIIRWTLLAALILCAAVAAYVLSKTPLGAKLTDRPFVLNWVGRHPLASPLTLVGIYVLFAVLMLPVWQIQLAAGYGFGLVWGIAWCTIGAMIGGVIALLLSRWLVGNWFRDRYESRIARLHALNEKLGHNGFFVVQGVRLCHILPFGLSNYLFGLTRIAAWEVFLGTLGGGVPSIGAWVIVGAGRAKHWSPWIVLATLNVVMLVPLGLRYFKPQWFQRSSSPQRRGDR